MKMTVTLDDDVATAIQELRRARGTGLSALVNELLREGLREARARPALRERFRTETVDLGALRIGSIDNVAEALAAGEQGPFEVSQ